MICPKCGGKLGVTHSYGTPCGKTQRLECVDCSLAHTAITTIVNTDPSRGEGAAALAKRMLSGEKTPWISTPS